MGRHGDRDRGGGGSSKEICRQYRNTGNCRFGASCKFLHDSPSKPQEDGSNRSGRPRESKAHKKSRAGYNRWRVILKDVPGDDEIFKIWRIWDDALYFLNGPDRDVKQCILQDLDDEDKFRGREIMLVLMSSKPSGQRCWTFVGACRYFLAVMTHTALVDSLSNDTYVGSLYNFISGHNGTRAIPFFQRLCKIILELRKKDNDSSDAQDLDNALLFMALALCELLKREARPRRNEDLPALVDSLEKAANLLVEVGSSYTANVVLQRVSDLRGVISRAEGLVSEIADNLADLGLDSGPTSSYPQRKVMPQDRHDNDKADITQINIFPTLDEIMSEAQEYLPSTHPGEWHYLTNKVERHIDTHFRLFRYDTFGALKSTLANIMRHIGKSPNQLFNPRLDLGDTRAYVYTDALVESLAFGIRGSQESLQALVSFLQPPSIRFRPASDQLRWWEDSERLSDGVLMSFIWIDRGVVRHTFFTVTSQEVRPAVAEQIGRDRSRKPIFLKLMKYSESNVGDLVDLNYRKTRGMLLEFPNIIPSTFAPVLENLQKMQRLGRLPFSQWIIPDQGSEDYVNILPPLYARASGFSFSMNAIKLDNAGPDLNVYPSSSTDDEELLVEMEGKIGLDKGQCRAMVAALTREFAFIQGPPGTGKTHLGIKLMKVLLEAKKKADLGPLVVVCYTNHALDQFLEHLVKSGVNKVIRIGSRSRSKLLEAHNLRVVTQNEMKTKSEARQMYEAYRALEDYDAIIGSILTDIQPTIDLKWDHFKEHLRDNHPAIYAQFGRVDEAGFTKAGRHPFDAWASSLFNGIRRMQSLPKESPKELAAIKEKAAVNVNSLSIWEGYSLVQYWSKEMQQEGKAKLFETLNDSIGMQKHLKSVQEEVRRHVLEDADVIGMTTTGLAKNIATLQRVRCKVVICEEAGEVLEAQMITSMLPTVEHCIQIGDHQQLRPSINEFDLSLESPKGRLYKLDRSQFERLCIGERGWPRMPIVQLNVQRRMRPEISTLIRETVYDKLIDHPYTADRANVVGMRQNVFWLDHKHIEDQKQTEVHHTKSKSNAWEVDMTHALVRHLIRQGAYKSTEITVLTPYTGQLQRLRAKLHEDFEIVLSKLDQDALARDELDTDDKSKDQIPAESNRKRPLEIKHMSDLLRLATVDNFQGEEAKVIIVSLVRSNEEKTVGFLRTTNRINVLLSRARNGMYLIGNTNTYSNVTMWQKVIELLRARNCVGPALELCCPRHTDKIISVQRPDDFSKYSPEGGCRERCDKHLSECGHMCQARCHSDSMHDVWRCEMPCERLHRPCNHPCQKATCGEECGKCMILHNDVKLPCGHVKNRVPCHLTQNLARTSCYIRVTKESPGCGHKIEVKCSEDLARPAFRCPASCGTVLPCGHPCPGSCGGCNKNKDGEVVVEHQKCRKKCGRRFGTCNHSCNKLCHDGSDCGLCEIRCEVRCSHSRCTQKCHEACAPCIMPCTWSCEHQGSCTMPCAAPCSRLPCEKRCTKLLLCGHQCPSLCGETCPESYCQECGTRADAEVDMIEFKNYSDIDLNESPIVVLGCRHFFTAESLDGLVGLHDMYEVDKKTGEMAGPKNLSRQLSLKIPFCPHCRTPIRQHVTQRYSRLINRAVIDEMSKRFIVSGQTQLQEFEAQLQIMEDEFSNSREVVIFFQRNTSTEEAGAQYGKEMTQRLRKLYGGSPFNPPSKLLASIIQFQKTVNEQHEPAYKLHAATISFMRRQADATQSSNALLDIRPHSADHGRIEHGAQMMKIKTLAVVLRDKFQVLATIGEQCRRALPYVQMKDPPHDETEPFLHCCTTFISDCEKTKLPKLAIEATLCYASIARHYQASGSANRETATKYRNTAISLLEKAQTLCSSPFNGANVLLAAVIDTITVLREKWYEPVTREELAAIKMAMVSGPEGIATHSGHWYDCVNGHTFAIGECGMPMEQARCPECGAQIGGQNHLAVEGVTRAEHMEN